MCVGKVLLMMMMMMKEIDWQIGKLAKWQIKSMFLLPERITK